MKHPRTALPRTPLAAALLAGLALSAPAHAGGTQFTTVQNGPWNDPATWDLGLLPDAATGDQADVRDVLIVDAPGATANVLTVQSGTFEDYFTALRIVDGGTLDANLTVLGSTHKRGSIYQTGGQANLYELRIGSTFDVGLYAIAGGTLQCDSVDVGQFFGATEPFSGRLYVEGGGAVIDVADSFRVAADCLVEFQPDAGGPSGLSTVNAHDLNFAAGSSIAVRPDYPAEVGDRWDLFTYSGTLSGTLLLESSFIYGMSLDTSVPGIISAEITSSPYPIAGNLCGDAVVLDPAGDTALVDTAFLTNENPDACFFSNPWTAVGPDSWYSVTNASSVPRAYRVSLTPLGGLFDNTGMELYDGCDGALIGCAGLGSSSSLPPGTDAYPDLDVLLPPGETYLVRVASGISGSIQYDLTLDALGEWSQYGTSLGNAAGVAPHLDGSGDLTAGSPCAVDLTQAASLSQAGLFLGLGAETPAPFKGGTLYVVPFLQLVILSTDTAGEISLPFAWPAGVPSGTIINLQWAVVDATGPAGFTLSNGLRAIAP